jgi:hypothetical protein
MKVRQRCSGLTRCPFTWNNTQNWQRRCWVVTKNWAPGLNRSIWDRMYGHYFRLLCTTLRRLDTALETASNNHRTRPGGVKRLKRNLWVTNYTDIGLVFATIRCRIDAKIGLYFCQDSDASIVVKLTYIHILCCSF